MMIEGRAVLEQPTVCFGGVLRVRLLDVDRIDAPSIAVAETHLRETARDAIDTIAFSLTVDAALSMRRRYQIAAHLDLDGDGRVGRGDLVTTESYPWRPDQQGSVSLRMRRVM